MSAHPEHPQQGLGLLRGDGVAKATRLGEHVWADGGLSRCLKVAEGGEVPAPGSLPCTISPSPWSSPLSKPLLEVVSLGCHRKKGGGGAGFGGEPHKIHILRLLPIPAARVEHHGGPGHRAQGHPADDEQGSQGRGTHWGGP